MKPLLFIIRFDPKDTFIDCSEYKNVFNAANPSVCEIKPAGTCGVPSLNVNLEWQLTYVPGSTRSTTPDPPKGATPTFTYTGLPANNSSFNVAKILSLDYPGSGCTPLNTVIWMFFPRDEMNHPGTGSGTIPNWYYYWTDGSVVAGLSDLTYGGDHPTRHGEFSPPSTLRIFMKAAGTMPGTTRTHQYWIVNESVDPPTYDSVSGYWTGKASKRPSFTFATRKGIYNCRSVVLHEKQHKVNYDAINGGGDSDAADSDGCPDSQEGASGGTPYYFSAKFKDTYDWAGYAAEYAGYGDNEMLARMAGEGVAPADVKPNEDWSDTNGCNW